MVVLSQFVTLEAYITYIDHLHILFAPQVAHSF